MFNNTLSTAPRSWDLEIFLFLFLSRAAKCAAHARLQIQARRRSAGCFCACSGASGVWVTVGVGVTPADLNCGRIAVQAVGRPLHLFRNRPQCQWPGFWAGLRALGDLCHRYRHRRLRPGASELIAVVRWHSDGQHRWAGSRDSPSAAPTSTGAECGAIRPEFVGAGAASTGVFAGRSGDAKWSERGVRFSQHAVRGWQSGRR